MEETTTLQGVTRKLLRQVEEVLDQGDAGLSELKQVAAVLKDIRDVQKEAQPKDAPPAQLRVVLEGQVEEWGR